MQGSRGTVQAPHVGPTAKPARTLQDFAVNSLSGLQTDVKAKTQQVVWNPCLFLFLTAGPPESIESRARTTHVCSFGPHTRTREILILTNRSLAMTVLRFFFAKVRNMPSTSQQRPETLTRG